MWHFVGLLFLYGALDSHPLFPSHVASGRCILSAAAVGAPAGVVSTFAEPSPPPPPPTNSNPSKPPRTPDGCCYFLLVSAWLLLCARNCPTLTTLLGRAPVPKIPETLLHATKLRIGVVPQNPTDVAWAGEGSVGSGALPGFRKFGSIKCASKIRWKYCEPPPPNPPTPSDSIHKKQ